MANWGQTWAKALTHPSVATYQMLAQEPTVGVGRPVVWVALSSILSALLVVGISYITRQAALQSTGFDFGSAFISTLLIDVLGSLIGFLLLVTVQHQIARAVGGQGTFGQQAYVLGAIFAPLSLLIVVVAAAPFIGFLSGILGLFGLVIEVIAVKAVYNFGWLKALLSTVVIWLVLGLIFFVLIAVILGPAVGTIFSNILRDNM